MKTVVYSHSDYDDILKIQLDYISNFLNPTLIFNKKKYFYDTFIYNDNLTYGERIFSSLINIKEEYVLFLHDIDIILNIDLEYIKNILAIMKINNIDRVDLKHQNLLKKDTILLNDEISLNKTKYPEDQYVYNVNPCIWKTKSMIKTFNIFRNESYRTIEHSQIQNYCSNNFNFYTVSSKKYINMGYYNCYEQFKYLHISHYGQFMPDDVSKNKMSIQNNEIYKNIINKYNLRHLKRTFRQEMH
jgi:hypothetical protein